MLSDGPGRLRRGQENFPVARRRAGEASARPSHYQQTRAVAIAPERSVLADRAAAEDEDVPRHGIVFQRDLAFSGQAVEAIAHAGNVADQPDPGAGGQADYSASPFMISRGNTPSSSLPQADVGGGGAGYTSLRWQRQEAERYR